MAGAGDDERAAHWGQGGGEGSSNSTRGRRYPQRLCGVHSAMDRKWANEDG